MSGPTSKSKTLRDLAVSRLLVGSNISTRAQLVTWLQESKPEEYTEYLPKSNKSKFAFGFELLIWSRQSPSTKDTLSTVISDITEQKCQLKSASYQCVLLFFRRDPTGPSYEAFALLAGVGADAAIAKIVDYGFPIRIAKRLLAPEYLQNDVRNLGAGNVLASQSAFRKPETTVHQQLNWIRSCACWLRHDASIRSVEPFNETFGEKQIKVTIRVSSVRVNVQTILLEHWPKMLNHFSSIVRGAETYLHPLVNPPVIESDDPFFDVLDEVTRVHSAPLRTNLDSKVLELLFDAITTNDDNVPFTIMHQHHDDYLACENVIFRYRKKAVDLGAAPALARVIQELSKVDAVSESVEAKDLHGFSKVISQIVMEFEKKSPRKKVKAKLLSFFEGSISHDSVVYFRVGGSWYSISGSYVTRMDHSYIDCMKQCVASSPDDACLPFPWSNIPAKAPNAKHDDQEGRYNFLYYGLKHARSDTCDKLGYVYGDKTFLRLRNTPDVELWDILNITEKFTYVIQVKIGFASSLRDACSQLRLSADLLTSHNSPTYVDRWLDEAISMASSKPNSVTQTQHDVHSRLLNYYKNQSEEWHNLFQANKLVFVLAIYDQTHDVASQARLFKRLESAVFQQEPLKDRNRVIPYEDLVRDLKHAGYIDDHMQPLPTLRHAKMTDFALPCFNGNQTCAERCFKQLHSAMFPTCSSLVSQSEVIHLHHHLSRLCANGLKITQIP